jgi:hypothetical protein
MIYADRQGGRRTMKRWMTLLLCLTLVSCAGWTEMSREKKIEATISYYRTFSAGLYIAADIAASVNPDLAPAVQTAKTTIKIMDAAVNSYAVHQTEEKAAIAYGAARAANAAVAEVAETVIPNATPNDQGTQIQSFFEGSTAITLCSQECRILNRSGKKWSGREIYCE